MFTLRIPRPPRFSTSPRTWHVVMVTAGICYSQGCRAQSAKGKAWGVKSGGDRAHASTHLPPAVKHNTLSSSTWEVLPARNPGSSSRAAHVRTPAWYGTQTPDSPKEAGSSINCAVCTHSFVILSLCCPLGNGGNPLESELQAGLSKDNRSRVAVLMLFCIVSILWQLFLCLLFSIMVLRFI